MSNFKLKFVHDWRYVTEERCEVTSKFQTHSELFSYETHCHSKKKLGETLSAEKVILICPLVHKYWDLVAEKPQKTWTGSYYYNEFGAFLHITERETNRGTLTLLVEEQGGSAKFTVSGSIVTFRGVSPEIAEHMNFFNFKVSESPFLLCGDSGVTSIDGRGL